MEPQAPIRQKIIREIKPSPVLQARTRNHKLRVAAYCRVSTEQEEQQTSIENQITYYDDLIRSNPEWEYAGVFSDAPVIIGLKTLRREKCWKRGAF